MQGVILKIKRLKTS